MILPTVPAAPWRWRRRRSQPIVDDRNASDDIVASVQPVGEESTASEAIHAHCSPDARRRVIAPSSVHDTAGPTDTSTSPSPPLQSSSGASSSPRRGSDTGANYTGPLIIQRIRTPTQSSVPGSFSLLCSHQLSQATTSKTKDMSKPWTRSPKLTGVKPPMPECWGHRGASAAYPENTIASFEMAIHDGAEGLESDVHITSDDVVIMFHDPSLERTTDGHGFIREQPWQNNIENVRTKAAPHQQIPTFHQVCELLMRPAHRHVKLNIDIKPENDPDRLFRLMRKSVESFPNFAEDLSPRLILGLWHPVFLRAALQHVPTLRRVHIGGSPVVARTYFWKHCDGFSMWFPSLVSADGQNFLEQARRESKDVFVWTVNRRDEMIEATRWGVKAILTDETAMMQNMRREMNSDYATTRSERVGMFFRWATWRYWMLPQFLIQAVWISELEGRAGISFKKAWKDDALHSNDPTAAVAEIASDDDSAAASDATLTNSDAVQNPGLVEEKCISSRAQEQALHAVTAAA